MGFGWCFFGFGVFDGVFGGGLGRGLSRSRSTWALRGRWLLPSEMGWVWDGSGWITSRQEIFMRSCDRAPSCSSTPLLATRTPRSSHKHNMIASLKLLKFVEIVKIPF